MKTKSIYQWAVVGAGPAGIAAVGKLLDQGILPEQIVWIDPEFKVGDFGQRWRNVSSNTTVKLFLQFLQGSAAFGFHESAHQFKLNQLDPEQTCELHYMADPLQWITNHLKEKVLAKYAKAHKLSLRNRNWIINLGDENITAKNVILAVGSEPNTFGLPNLETIPLEIALDKQRLQQTCHKTDRVAVFGSSHSAVIALRNLLECSVEQVVNFYRSPLCYAIYLDDWIVYDDTGLKGAAAEWARENIDGKQAKTLTRCFSSQESMNQHLPSCNKVVYAIGFTRRELPVIEDFPSLDYNPHNGILAPGLFGLGIAFPEAKLDRFGTLGYRVGLWKFMDYLNRTLPLWLRYGS